MGSTSGILRITNTQGWPIFWPQSDNLSMKKNLCELSVAKSNKMTVEWITSLNHNHHKDIKKITPNIGTRWMNSLWQSAVNWHHGPWSILAQAHWWHQAITWTNLYCLLINSLWPSNATWCDTSQVNIGWGNGLLADSNKPLPKPMLHNPQ